MCIHLPGVMGEASEMGRAGAAPPARWLVDRQTPLHWAEAGKAPPPACVLAQPGTGPSLKPKGRAGCRLLGCVGQPHPSLPVTARARFSPGRRAAGLDAAWLALTGALAGWAGPGAGKREGAGVLCLWPMPEPAWA